VDVQQASVGPQPRCSIPFVVVLFFLCTYCYWVTCSCLK